MEFSFSKFSEINFFFENIILWFFEKLDNDVIFFP